MPSAAPRTDDVPSSAEIKRAEDFIREPVLLGDEDASTALADGTARRRAIDQALAEASEGLPAPSTHWRRRWSLLLGLERMLSVDEPTLADGTTQLGPHQVDALSGTLTALLTEEQAHSVFVPERESLDDDLPRNRRRGGSNGERRSDDQPGALAGANGSLSTSTSSVPDLDAERDDDYDDEGVSGEGSDVHGPTIEELAPTAEELAELDAIDFSETDELDAFDDEQLEEQAEDPNAAKRFWFEHATGAGKTVAAMGFVDACRLGGVLILTHRRNLVEQFIDEIKTRGYKDRLSPPLLKGEDPVADRNTLGPVTVETYQWFVRHAGEISSAYTIVICDEAHTALGEKTSAAIRAWTGPIFIGMTATGALIARHVADLFPTQTSRFDLAQAARRGVIAPLRCIRIPPGVGVRTIAKVPLRRGEVDMEFDQDMLAEVLDQLPFNLAAADLYKTRFGGMPGVVYAAGVRHAYNLADAFNEMGIKAKAVSGETPKRELSRTLADYESGKIDVLVNAQLLAEGWNSPRATVCLHLAPTASKRIYQQRVGRVTRREPGKEAGLVVDFVHPGTKHDDPVVTLHSLLERDVYRGGAIVVGPVRRGRGRKIRVERRVLPVASDTDTRLDIFKRELWRIAVEHLDYGEQVQWAALAGAQVSNSNWRKARAMLHFDRGGELKRAFLVTAIKRNASPQVKLKAVQDIAALRDPEAFADAVDEITAWKREDRRDAVRILLQSIADRPVGRRDQATAWIWQLAEATADEHEDYATQRWKEGKRLLGLLVNSAGPAHGRNARRLVQASREQDRRLQAGMLAAARPHTPEAMQVITGARTRLARKPGALARELLRNIPKAAGGAGGGPSKGAQGKKGGQRDQAAAELAKAAANGAVDETEIDATGVIDAAAEGNDTATSTEDEKPAVIEYEAYTFEGEAAELAAERGGSGAGKRSRRSRNRRRKKSGEKPAASSKPSGSAAKGKADASAEGESGAGASATATVDAPAKSGDGADGATTGTSRRSRRRRKKRTVNEDPAATASNGSGDANGNDAPAAKASNDDNGATPKASRRPAKAATKPTDAAAVTSAIAEAAAALKGTAPKAEASAKADAAPNSEASGEAKPRTRKPRNRATSTERAAASEAKAAAEASSTPAAKPKAAARPKAAATPKAAPKAAAKPKAAPKAAAKPKAAPKASVASAGDADAAKAAARSAAAKKAAETRRRNAEAKKAAEAASGS